MKRKITTTALLVAFALLALFIPEKTILPKAVAENIDAPKLEVIEGVYNMAVKYMWRVGRGGDTLTLSTSSAIYAPIDDVYYEEYAFPNFFSSYKECTPHYTHAKSYSYSTGTYSEETSNGIDILISD